MRELWFVIWKRIRIRSSEARIRSKNVGGAREGLWPCLGHPMGSPWDPRPEQPSGPVGHTHPTWECDMATSNSLEASPYWKLLKLLHSPPFILRRKIEKEEHQKFSLNFCFLTLIITLSYELEIEWSKNQNCWSWRELQTPSIFRVIWIRDCSQQAVLQSEFHHCMLNFFFSLHLLICTLIFQFDRWFVFRMMLEHILGVVDHLVIEF